MRGKEIITKLIIPGAIAMIICLIVHPMCMNGEILDWRKLLLFVGIPFGIQKMFLLVVPRNVGTGEMLGWLVLKLMVGSLIGIGVLAWRLLAVAGILLKNSISGIIWIIKRLKEMVIKNERKQLEKLYYSIYPMNQCETQSKSYEETKELCETLEKEMISLMSPDLQAMFEDYKEYTLNLKQTEQRDAYIDGLAFGIRTISEAFLHENKNRIW